MSLALAQRVADAVLYEGYVLYPYRASAAKNRLRWQVGLVAPRSFCEAAGSDPWSVQAECLAEAGPAAVLTVRVRALHVQPRTVESPDDSHPGGWRPAARLDVDGRQLLTWDEAVDRELVLDALPLAEAPFIRSYPWALEPAEDIEVVPGATGTAAARVVRRRLPVLVGAEAARAIMLASPIILPDYPSVAPESPGDSCDATEIDEMLMLRVRTLTENEQREARATDDRAAQIVDRACAASPGLLESLHGAVRRFAGVDLADGGWETLLNPRDQPPPEADAVDVGPHRISRGSRVRLQPSRRADSLDIVLHGRAATVTGVYRTLEDVPYVAVTLDDDPMRGAAERYRRALFFHPDEIVPLDAATGGGT